MRDRELVTTIPHPTAGTLPNIRLPFRMAGTPLADPVAAPALGEHSEPVLRGGLGYGDADVARLRGTGAVRMR